MEIKNTHIWIVTKNTTVYLSVNIRLLCSKILFYKTQATFIFMEKNYKYISISKI